VEKSLLGKGLSCLAKGLNGLRSENPLPPFDFGNSLLDSDESVLFCEFFLKGFALSEKGRLEDGPDVVRNRLLRAMGITS
jgi:hypothetical protein